MTFLTPVAHWVVVVVAATHATEVHARGSNTLAIRGVMDIITPEVALWFLAHEILVPNVAEESSNTRSRRIRLEELDNSWSELH